MSEERFNNRGLRYIFKLSPLLIGGIVVYELAVIISLLSFNLVQGAQNTVMQPFIIMQESPNEPSNETANPENNETP